MRVEFHAIAAGGDAVGRGEDGRVVFAPHAAPGDIAEVTVDEEHRSFTRGHVVRLQNASTQRAVPPCPYFRPADAAPSCGGCQIQHLDYAAQLEAKRAIVRDALRRIGGVQDDVVQACLASPQPFAYRNKADFQVAFIDGRAHIGFHARGSHRVIDVARCPIQQEPNNQLLAAVRSAIAAALLSAMNLRGLLARTASNGDSLLHVITSEDWPQSEAFARHLHAMLPALTGVLHSTEKSTQPRLLSGRDWLEETVLGLRLRVSGTGFFQINSALTPTLVETALRLAGPQPGELILDLFCGAGLFTLALARQGAQVLGIEAVESAIADARFNAGQNGLAADFVADRAARALVCLARDKSRRQTWDTVLLDPPREGAAACMEPLAHPTHGLRPRRIVYVSCDPATLARDVKTLAKFGYRLKEAVPLDLFPQTAHVETAARLARA